MGGGVEERTIDRRTVPKDVNVLTPQKSEYVTFHGKGLFESYELGITCLHKLMQVYKF